MEPNSTPVSPASDSSTQENSFKDIGFQTLDAEEIKQAELKKNLEIQSKYKKKFFKNIGTSSLIFLLTILGFYVWNSSRLANNLVLSEKEKNIVKTGPLMSIYDKLPSEKVEVKNNPIISTGNLKTDQENFDSIVNSNGEFLYQKRDDLATKLTNLISSMSQVDKNIDIQLQQYISNGYYPQEISNILNDSEIQKPIVTIESIKLSTALQFYSLLPSFVQEYATKLGISSDVAQAYINYYKQIPDTDVLKYVQMCYMNPYLGNYQGSCQNEQDFVTYFSNQHVDNMSRIIISKNGTQANLVDKTDKNVGANITRNFVILMDLLIDKLDNTKLPALVITFNSFDPKTSTLKFSIEINSFDSTNEELKQAMGNNIISPHEFMVTNLINLIRQSRLIKSDSINISDQTIQTTNVKEGTNVYKKYTSRYDFELPVQKSIEREVSDFDNN